MKIKNMNFAIIILLLLPHSFILSQSYSSPYPIIFVHGLNDFEGTWDPTINFLGPTYGSKQVFHAVLNAYKGVRSLEGPDGILGTNDDDVLLPIMDYNGDLVNQLHNGNLFVINFWNFWNEDSINPKIWTYSDGVPDDNESKGNQAAIYKQGYALSKCIKEVLDATGAKKVILVGHSMGGLAIREYLQRRDSTGRNIWWADPNDKTNGHHVAKVVTIGSPHLGSDFFNVTIWIPGNLPDLKSEAVRDMRYSYNLTGNPPNVNDNGIYLYGGNENRSELTNYYNQDVNCNGNQKDFILGINSPNIPGNYSILMPLSTNIAYSWIVSDYMNWGSDGIVSARRQYLYNIGDTLLTNKPHIQYLGNDGETKDYYSIIRGLDEPNSPSLAYEIGNNSKISGFITYQKNNIPSDTDLYKIIFKNDGYLTLYLGAVATGVNQIALLGDDGKTLDSTSTFNTINKYYTKAGTYYIRVKGEATIASYLHPYILTTSFAELQSGFVDELDGSTLGSATGIAYTNTPFNKGAVFSRINNSRIVYSFDSQVPREGTLELLIKVESGYNYSNYVLSENLNSAQIWATDCQGGDVFWPGAMRIGASNDGTLNLITETVYGQPQYTVLTASNTSFKFNEWHSIGISYGSQGQYLSLDGKVVASNTTYTLPLSAAGNFSQPMDKPTIGQVVSSFWDKNQYDGGFNGVVDKFRTSDKQKDWSLNVTAIKDVYDHLPQNYSLFQNYPNPFNPSSIIRYDLPKEGMASIKMYDMLGREVKTLVDEYKSAGSYTIEFNASNLTSGVYFYHLQTSEFSQTKKLILMK